MVITCVTFIGVARIFDLGRGTELYVGLFGFGPNVDKNFGLNSGLRRTFCLRQARSQKFATGGGCLGGLGAEPPAAGSQWGSGSEASGRWGFGGKPPADGGTKILHFFAKITSF